MVGMLCFTGCSQRDRVAWTRAGPVAENDRGRPGVGREKFGGNSVENIDMDESLRRVQAASGRLESLAREQEQAARALAGAIDDSVASGIPVADVARAANLSEVEILHRTGESSSSMNNAGKRG